MIDLKWLKEHEHDARAGFAAKGFDVAVDQLLRLDVERRALLQKVEAVAAEKHAASKELRHLAGVERTQRLSELRERDAKTDGVRARLREVERELAQLLNGVPNLPLPDVTVGQSEEQNEVLRTVGEPPRFPFTPRAYWELGPELGVYDTERGAKVSGARFGYLTGPGATLEFALVWYARSVLERHGFMLVIPPVLISARAMEAMGYTLHGGTQETYFLPEDQLYLVGTSEQSLGPFHMDEVLDAEELPLRYMGFSSCFRREAGSYGKDTRGLFRVHQFDKVEMFSFVHPNEGDAEHERMLAIEEELLSGLGIAYQVVKMVTGDLGVPAARKYDLEAWFPSERRYRELTSTSTCTDWQARRLNVRARSQGAPSFLVHTLNGTAFAIGRTICALLENGQQEDGSVVVPEVLRDMVGMDRITPG